MIHDLINFKGYKSILCLNCELPPIDFFAKHQLPIIAADGAANSLYALGLHPAIIVGDLDSVDSSLLAKYPFLHLPDQNSNDYQKTLAYLQENQLLPSIVVGINGGYLDHILNNINIFMSTDCLLYAPPLHGWGLNSGSEIDLILPKDSKISLIGIPHAVISSQGLKWELSKNTLSFPGSNSCYNRTVLPKITLEVHEGKLLILVYENPMPDAGQ